MEEYPHETWNPYASPAPLPEREMPDMFSRPGMDGFAQGMDAVRCGIGWVLLGLFMPLAAVLLGVITLGILASISFLMLIAVPIMHLWGMRRCLECPESVASYARELINTSRIFYLICFVLFFPAFAVGPGAGDWLLFFALACLGFSGVAWQVFLLRLAQGLRSRWLTNTVRGLLAVYILGGFAMLVVWLISWKLGTAWTERHIPPADAYESFLRVLYFRIGLTAAVAGLIYAVTYLGVLIGLRMRIDAARWVPKEWE